MPYMICIHVKPNMKRSSHSSITAIVFNHVVLKLAAQAVSTTSYSEKHPQLVIIACRFENAQLAVTL